MTTSSIVIDVRCLGSAVGHRPRRVGVVTPSDILNMARNFFNYLKRILPSDRTFSIPLGNDASAKALDIFIRYYIEILGNFTTIILHLFELFMGK